MEPVATEPHVLILRVWFEPTAVVQPMRVRIIELGGFGARGETLAVLTSAQEAGDVVSAWLEGLVVAEGGRTCEA